MKLPDYNNRLRVLVATYVTFSPDGTELLVNMGGEQVMHHQTEREPCENRRGILMGSFYYLFVVLAGVSV